MSRQGIFTGFSPNDGTGDSLASGAVKINANFQEIYNVFGDGNNLLPINYVNSSGISSTATYATTAGISTLTQGITGSPNVILGVVTASSFNGSGSGLTSIPAGQLTGTLPAIDGSNLTGIVASGSGVVVREEGTSVGTAQTINFLGIGVTATVSGGIANIEITSFSGDYNDLTNQPSIPSITGLASEGYVNNLVSISTFSGNYNDLTNTPTALSSFSNDVGFITSYTETSTLNVVLGRGNTSDIGMSVGVVTASSFSGSGVGLTNIPAGQLTGALPAIDGSALIGVVGSGSGVEVLDSGTPVGTAGTINFGSNLTVSPVSAGVVTVTASGGGGESYWSQTESGIHTLSNVGVGTTNPQTALYLNGVLGFKNSNVRIGSNQTSPDVTGSSNICIGDFAGASLSDGTRNVLIGDYSNAFGLDGSYNVMVGYRGSSQGSHNIQIGEYITGGSGSNQVVIGNGDFTNNYNFGVPDSSKDIQFAVGVNTTGNNISDSKYWLIGDENFNIGIGTTNATSKLTVGGDVKVSGVVTATSFIGDGSGLTGITATGSGVEIRDNGSLVGTASTIDFGDNLTVSPISAGVGTVTVVGFITSYTEISTLNDVLTRGNTSSLGISVGVVTASAFIGDGSGLTNLPGPSTGIGTFNAVVGVSTTIDSFDIAAENISIIEYNIFINNGGNRIQSQKTLVMLGDEAYSQEYAIIYTTNHLVSVGATISGGICNVTVTPSSGVSGLTTFKFSKGGSV